MAPKRNQWGQRSGARRALQLELLENRIVLSGPGEGIGAEGSGLALARFESSEQLSDFLRDDALQRFGDLFGQPAGWWRYYPDYPMPFFGGAFDNDVMLRAPGAAEAVPDHSETNTQVTGVDEGDIVETDGQFLYIVSGQDIVIVDARADQQLEVASRIPVDGQPMAEYLRGDYLTVLSYAYDEPSIEPWFGDPLVRPALDIAYPVPAYQPRLKVTIVDVSTPAAPSIAHEAELDGSLVDSRAIGDFVYLVMSDGFGLPAPEVQCTALESDGNGDGQEPYPGEVMDGRILPPPPGENCVYETREEYLSRIEGEVLDLALPHYSSFDADGQLLETGLLTEATDIYRPATDEYHNLMSVVVFEMSDQYQGLVESTGVPTTYSTEIYASTDSLYLLNPDWGGIRENGPATSILKFDLNAEDRVNHVVLTATGEVPGQVLNSFSIDEYDTTDGDNTPKEYLRIATTVGWGRESDNRVYVLDDMGGNLRVIGQTGNLAQGEQIYSVRFMEETAYVVTFLRVDPLFVLDLSVPSEPRVTGELHIPGFSNYLHPIGDQYLIGLGNSADEETGRVEELQVSLFFVPESGNPELVSRFPMDVPDWAWSEATHDHHAFALYPHPDQAEDRVLALPITSGNDLVAVDRDGDRLIDMHTYRPRTELWVFHVDLPAEGGGGGDRPDIGLIGQIEHEAQVRRSVRIGRELFAISDSLVTVHDLLEPKVERARLHFGQEDVGVPVFQADARDERVSFAIAAAERAAPQVLDIAAASTTWSREFVNSLDRGAIPVEPMGVLPFGGIDQIKVRFSEDVLVGWSDLRLVASDRTQYAVRDFSYDPDIATAVWTLSQPLGADTATLQVRGVVDLSGQPLDGDGDGQAGGRFSYQLNVLPGDVNRDGLVDRVDLVEVTSSPASRLGDISYHLSRDIDGSGQIDEADFSEVGSRAGTSLPSEATSRLGPGDANGDGRFDHRDIVQVLQRGKYLIDRPAIWSEGDWNRDGRFDQLDLVAALQHGRYLSEPSAPAAAGRPPDIVDVLFAEDAAW